MGIVGGLQVLTPALLAFLRPAYRRIRLASDSRFEADGFAQGAPESRKRGSRPTTCQLSKVQRSQFFLQFRGTTSWLGLKGRCLAWQGEVCFFRGTTSSLGLEENAICVGGNQRGKCHLCWGGRGTTSWLGLKGRCLAGQGEVCFFRGTTSWLGLEGKMPFVLGAITSSLGLKGVLGGDHPWLGLKGRCLAGQGEVCVFLLEPHLCLV